MRFLSEIENQTEMISEDLMEVPEIAKAVELTKESSYSKAQLETYDKYWDSISVEKTFIADAEAKGINIGGERKAIETAKNLKIMDKLTIEEIADVTGLSFKIVEAL
jgi:hypothetical protein